MDKFSEISEESLEFFNSILKKINQPFSLKFAFINNEKLKGAIKIQKIPDVYQFICKGEMLVIFNENLFNMLDDQAKEILLRQELDKISVNLDTGKIKMIKPDVITFSGILKKFGLDSVARANQLSELIKDKVGKEAETFFEK